MEKEGILDLKNLTANETAYCYSKMYQEFDTKICNCSTPCREVSYDVKVKRKPWPQKWLTKKYKKLFAQALNKTEKELSDEENFGNFLKISIYFDDFVTTSIREEELYSYENLISDIGGLMGFYLGASIVSIIEMIWLVMKWLKSKIQMSTRVKAFK